MGLKNKIHQALEGHLGVAEAEGHHEEFVVAFVSANGCLVDIFFHHPDLVVTCM